MQVFLTYPRNNLPDKEMGWSEEGLMLPGAWLAEALRMEGSRQFALATVSAEKKYGFSKTLTLNALKRQLDVEDTDILKGQLKLYFETLVCLQDFGHLDSGKGYIPRESRATIFTRKWGRLSGGLPQCHNECPDDQGVQLISGTIGRLALMPTFRNTPASWEINRTYRWEIDQCKAEIREIELLVDESVNLTLIQLEYYQTKLPPRVLRFNCWGSRHPGGQVNVARSRSDQHRTYYLVNSSTTQVMGIPISRDKAMLYLLFLDLQQHRSISCYLTQKGALHTLKVPKYLPYDWTYALMAASRDYADANSCIKYALSDQALLFAEELLTAVGCKIIKNYV